MLTEPQLRFLRAGRVGHLATASAGAAPHIVPVCYAPYPASVYITIDAKPKRKEPAGLKRVRNLLENPRAAFSVDHYDDDWSRLGFVLVHGRGDVLREGTEHDDAQSALKMRYPQLVPMDIAPLPVIAIRIERVTAWGRLDAIP